MNPAPPVIKARMISNLRFGGLRPIVRDKAFEATRLECDHWAILTGLTQPSPSPHHAVSRATNIPCRKDCQIS